ncbi:RNA 2'-phosphotransferase [Nocardioides speluncae]|uniref:RNA 2'-phosphotransferase n=1 Tax=Nocardioides speluncae TaxID=2670337 RepID=UPI001F0C55A6|nr:RNA 2'-phosphotransferase [Nocardioides speluncae]
MRSDERVKISKRMSLALRHAPERFGLRLDRAGWVDVTDLLTALELTRDQLDEVVATNDKQRFALSADGDRIRANQGHSIAVELDLAVAVPPAVLFHGTVAMVLPAIMNEGLRPMRRHDVHLSASTETARRVGARRVRRSSLRSRPRGCTPTATPSASARTASG